MSTPAKIRAFTSENFAQLFLQLWQMEDAGVSCVEAVNLLKNQTSPFKQPLTRVQQRLKSGGSIAEAGFRGGLFNAVQRTLIQAGETAGCLSTVYKRLADYYEQKAGRERKIKSRLYLPVFTLAVALFVQPLPDWVGARISAVDYLQLSAGRLLLILTGGFLFLRFPFWLAEGFLSRFKLPFDSLQLHIPGVRNWVIRRQINDFLFILAMLLEAGLPFAQALPQAVDSIKNAALRAYFKPALVRLNQGETVSEILSQVPVMNATTLALLTTGEQSGKLAESLLRVAKLEAQTIQLQNELLAEWLPRLVYLVIALWVGYSILRQWMQIFSAVPF
jgi:general secretion pathway protein F